MPDSPPSLWPLQVRVLRLVRRGVPAAAGFALAGGAALVVHGVVDRPTEDLRQAPGRYPTGRGDHVSAAVRPGAGTATE